MPIGLKKICVVTLLMAVSGPGIRAQSSSGLRAAREHLRAGEHRIVSELIEFLSIPNVSADLPNIRRNASHLQTLMQRRGIDARILEWETVPLVYGELRVPEPAGTLLFYCHYDGDPVDPDRWTDSRPFEPVLRDASLEKGGEIISLPEPGTPYRPDWRVYARSASDDKAPIIALLAALDALQASGVNPRFNLKFLFEGEEEVGSPHLGLFLARYRDLFESDLVIFADGPVYPTGDPTLYFGVRGIAKLEITVYGALRNLHSGHFGNWAPNPAELLSQLLASMKDERGRVVVERFYDGVRPLSVLEKEALEQVPSIEEGLRNELALAVPEGGERRLSEQIVLPSLNVHGVQSGWVGEQARNIIPTEAQAAIDLRLVPDIEPDEQAARVVEHIRKQGFHVVKSTPSGSTRRRYEKIARVDVKDGYPGLRTPMDHPLCMQVSKAVEAAAGSVVRLPTMGGSVPLYLFQEQLQTPVLGLPTVNHDNNQHSPNENLRLDNFFRAIEIFAAVFTM